VIVKTRALLVPPLEQPRSPEVPLGVLTVTLAVPGAEIKTVVIVTCNSSLLTNVVLSVVPLIITTEDGTNWVWDEQDNKLSFTFRASVNRVYKQRYDQEQAEWRRTHKRIPLFSPEARLLKKGGMEPAGIRWLRELKRSPRVTDGNRVAESEATDGAALDLERRALLDRAMSSLIERAAAMHPQSRADLPGDQNEKKSV
jgi:hypothetical protein